MLRAVLFDLDDTLIDHSRAAAAAVGEWALEHGMAGADVAGRWARVSQRHYSRYQAGELSFSQQRRERVREFLGVSVDDAQADALFAGYLSRYEAGWQPFPDALAALRTVRAVGLLAAILTNGDEAHQREKLRRCKLEDEVDLFVASSSLPARKPDPRAFTHVLDRLGVEAAAALMVGNSLANDVHGALAAGMRAVLLDREGTASNADVHRIGSLDSLPLSS